MANQYPLILKSGKYSRIKPGDVVPLDVLPSALVQNDRITSVAAVNTASATFSVVSSLSFTMAEAGNYLFHANLNATNGTVNGSGEFAIFKNNVVVAGTQRTFACTTSILGLITLSTNSITTTVQLMDKITCAANDVIDVRYRSTNGQSITVSGRTFVWARVI